MINRATIFVGERTTLKLRLLTPTPRLQWNAAAGPTLHVHSRSAPQSTQKSTADTARYAHMAVVALRQNMPLQKSQSVLALPKRSQLAWQCQSLLLVRGSPNSLIDLRRQVELQVAVVCVLEAVPHQQGRVRAQAELHGAAQRRGLGKIHKIPEGECGRDRLMNGEGHLLLGLVRVPGLQHHVAGAHVALNAERDAL